MPKKAKEIVEAGEAPGSPARPDSRWTGNPGLGGLGIRPELSNAWDGVRLSDRESGLPIRYEDWTGCEQDWPELHFMMCLVLECCRSWTGVGVDKRANEYRAMAEQMGLPGRLALETWQLSPGSGRPRLGSGRFRAHTQVGGNNLQVDFGWSIS